MSKKQQSSAISLVFKSIACVLVFVIAFVAGFAGYFILTKPNDDQSNIVTNQLSIHVIQLGNGKSGDSVYIKAGATDILVDGGSDYDSMEAITEYVDNYVDDNKLEFVIVTHGDLDHIANFAGSSQNDPTIFDEYECEIIIDAPLTNKTTQAYSRYVTERDAEIANGAKHYTALECWNNENGAQRSYDLGFGTTLNILYQKYYEEKDGSDENNHSVCFMITQGDRNFLFTGDLEYDGEQSLVESNNLPEVDFFKAGHHGSKTSSNDFLLQVIKPDICVASCAAGSVQYTQNLENTFPTQAFVDRISLYTDKVYVPTYVNVYQNSEGEWEDEDTYNLLNGHIVVVSNSKGISVNCSNNNTILKDTQWFRDNREMPSAWL